MTTTTILTVRQVLDVATLLADRMDEAGVEYNMITASGGPCSQQVQVHTSGPSAAIGPEMVAEMLSLPVKGVSYGPETCRYASVLTEFAGVSVNIFGTDLNEFAPVVPCGAVDEDDQGRRVCPLDRSHVAAGSAHQFAPAAK